MKVFTSYFYQVRFFKPYMIPVSTAIWDPQWYHDFKGQDHIFKDKNGIYNGIRCEELHPGSWANGLCAGKDGDLCKACNKIADPNSCEFLKMYEKQLNELDFNKLTQKLLNISKEIQQKEDFYEEPTIVLLVHEAYTNECSERKKLQELFENHGIECKELEYPINEFYSDKIY